VFALAAWLGLTSPAVAVPSFARQTGQECPACHVSWPELTPYGRYFKLTGYTIGKTALSAEGWNYIPLAAMLQGSVSSIKNNFTTDPNTGEVTTVMNRQNSAVFCCASLFVATKANDYIGAFIQMTYNNLATSADGTLGGHGNIDNTDIRAAYKYAPVDAAEPEWILGLTLNNNPTVQDPWNSTPAWGIPIPHRRWRRLPAPTRSSTAGSRSRLRDWAPMRTGKRRSTGSSRTTALPNVAGNVLRAGLPYDVSGGVLAITNFNPYWRLAYTHDWGANSIMLGAYGLTVNNYPDNLNTTTPTDRYSDIAIDGQYQYITDQHTFTAR
jgi:hypothetical protein